MSCHEHRRMLDPYVDGELDLRAALALEEHVEGCARCGAALLSRRALLDALHRHLPAEQTPVALRERLTARYGPAAERADLPGWRRWSLAAGPGVVALALAAWLMAASPPTPSAPPDETETRIVYHIASATAPGAALRNLSNHLAAAPDVRVVVVAHSEGVDFLLRGAIDEFGRLIEPAISEFRSRGVEFRVCSNTLERRSIGPDRVVPAATLVPSGMSEIGRLQSKEGYAYMRL